MEYVIYELSKPEFYGITITEENAINRILNNEIVKEQLKLGTLFIEAHNMTSTDKLTHDEIDINNICGVIHDIYIKTDYSRNKKYLCCDAEINMKYPINKICLQVDAVKVGKFIDKFDFIFVKFLGIYDGGVYKECNYVL